MPDMAWHQIDMEMVAVLGVVAWAENCREGLAGAIMHRVQKSSVSV